MRHILSVDEVPPDTPLLEGIDARDRERALAMLRARYITFDAGDFIRSSDSERRCAAYLVEGCADGFVYDEEGNRSILHLFMPGQIVAYGKVFGEQPLPLYDIVARDACRLLVFTTDYVPTTPGKGRTWAGAVRDNLAAALATLNAELMATLDIRLRRTIRGKAMAYLEHEALRQGKRSFDIVFNRQELADYLCVDRAALSRELGNLRAEGLVSFDRNHFELPPE